MELFDFITLSGVILMAIGFGVFAFGVAIFAVVLSFLLD